jgi:spore germination protein YaaH
VPQAARPARAARRAWLAALLAALVAAPATLTPAPASAATRPGVPVPDVEREQPAGPGEAIEPGPSADAAEPPEEPSENGLVPSIHYRDDQVNANRTFDFEPGGRVSVPFTPRAGDDWEVDGRAPGALPAGHATGRAMHEARQGSVWADGAPPGLVDARDPIGDGAGLDQPSGGDAVQAEPASATLGPSADSTPDVDAAPVGGGGLRREVFGFLPYWEVSDSSTVLDWRTLSTVAYFSVGCTGSGALAKRNPDGSVTTGWAGWTSSKMTSIIDAAHRNQTRVVLTISCFAWTSSGAATQARLLASATARTTLAKQAAAAVRDRGADGINLDFEPIAAGYGDEFVALVRAVRRELNAVAPGYQLTFDTLGSVGNQPIAEATAPGGADAVFIMGYDYRTAGASVAGSISPLTGPAYDLTDTVKAYTAKVSPSKLILGIPYYGRAWSTPTDALHARNISGAQYGGSAEPTYAQAAPIVAANGRRWDAVEQAPWTAYRRQSCTETYGCVTTWRQLYYDDAASLRLRYDLVNRSGLRGAGIWALGYDDARPELRQAIADKFRVDTTPPVAGITTLPQRVRDEGFRVAWTAYDDSAVRRYDVQVSTNGGGWWTWLPATTASSGLFLGRDGTTYAFRVRATDVHGNVSAWQALPLGSLGAPSSLQVGGWGAVVTDGLRLRSNPTTGASIMATLADGDALHVIGGPRQADGYTWFQVAGPVRQWPSVEAIQVGGWVAASGNGVTNVTPRGAAYATKVAAGLVGLRLNQGGPRFVTPTGDGVAETVRLDWTNTRAFDSMTLRVHRIDGTLYGEVAVPDTAAGPATWHWNAKVGGSLVPSGAYVLQLVGRDGAVAFAAPSASPVTTSQVARVGVMVGSMTPTGVAFRPPASPTRSTTLTYAMTFGSEVSGFARADLTRSGTATGCEIGTPTGSGRSWTVTLTGCSAGTVVLGLRAGAVRDPVGNVGPATQLNAPRLLIDRARPLTAGVRAALRVGAALESASPGTGLLANLTWSSTDPGGAGVATWDVARSRDGAPYEVIASGLRHASLAVGVQPGSTYRFRVRARDRAGNVGAWTEGAALRGFLVQQGAGAIAWTGTWKTELGSQISGGSRRYASVGGASAKVTFTGRAIAWVGTRASNRGVARVWLDGRLVATIDTRGAAADRVVLFARTWAASGTHTLRIVVAGTAGRPRVDVDAFEILR